MPETKRHINAAKPILPLAIACVTALALAGPAWAGGNAITGVPTPYVDIASEGPLEDVYVGNDLSCQIKRAGNFQIYPGSETEIGIPADCGTFASYEGVLYMPDFEDHLAEEYEEEDEEFESFLEYSSTGFRPLAHVTSEEVEEAPEEEHNQAFEPVSQSPVTGSGTANDPYTVITVVNAGTKLRLTQTDSYVVGNDYYTVTIDATNLSEEPLDVRLDRGQDCFLGGNDEGYGWVNGSAPACTTSENNEPAGFVEALVPSESPGVSYLETYFATNWRAIGSQQALPDSCNCEELEDNGDSVSFPLTIPGGQSQSVAVTHVFSPNGEVPPPPTAAPVLTTPPSLPETTAPEAGATLSANPGSAEGAEGYEYQWQFCTTTEPGSCVDIPGATGITFTPGEGQVGGYLRFVVKASNKGGTTTTASALVGPVQGAAKVLAPAEITPLTPVSTGPPAASASPQTIGVCRSTRAVTIHWKATRAMHLAQILVTVNGETYKRLRGKARRVRVNLSGRGREPVTILVTGTSKTGVRYATSRVYELCTTGRHRQLEKSQYLKR
ncbi:MAG TPA: hypothetical protein VH025_06020 [Solirubrobacteraceae bacterium]|nr:hypothetical protein [Solirubrobacteraceae bacterium]